MKKIKKPSYGQIVHPNKKIKFSIFYGFISAILFFLILGFISAVLSNQYFIRMTPVGFIEFGSLIISSILIGIYIGLFHFIKKNNLGKCNLYATTGGILGFLTFGCSICNQLLILVLGVSGVLLYFEPIRAYLGILSIIFLIYAITILIKIIKNK